LVYFLDSTAILVENTEATWGRKEAPSLDPAKDKIGNVCIVAYGQVAINKCLSASVSAD